MKISTESTLLALCAIGSTYALLPAFKEVAEKHEASPEVIFLTLILVLFPSVVSVINTLKN